MKFSEIANRLTGISSPSAFPGSRPSWKSRRRAASSRSSKIAACCTLLERAGVDGDERTVLYANHRGHRASWTFCSALGEMRGAFGVHLARFATQFKLDIEDKLAAILPEADRDERD
jgi:hypothetical protein